MELNPAEAVLVAATRDGAVAQFQGLPVIRAELIRRLMLGVPLQPGGQPVATPCGVRMTGARIEGELNLDNGRGKDASIMPGLVMDNCLIPDLIDLSYAQLGKLSLEKSHIYYVRAVRAVIEGELVLNDISPAPDKGFCFLSFHSAHIDGDVQLRRAVLKEDGFKDDNGSRHHALDLRNAWVNGDVVGRHMTVDGTLEFSSAVIEKGLTLRSSTLRSLPGRYIALALEETRIGTVLSLRRKPDPKADPCRIYGQVNATRLRADGIQALDLEIRPDGHTAPTPNCDAFDLSQAQINGLVNLTGQAHIEGCLKLNGMTVGGNFEAQGATLTRGLQAVGLKVGGSLHLSQLKAPSQTIGLEGAQIGSTLSVRGVDAALIDLRRVRTITMDDDADAHNPQVKLKLDGFAYDRFEHRGHERSKWLEHQAHYRRVYWWNPLNICNFISRAPDYTPKSRHFFRPQPFVQLAKVLETQGMDSQARLVRRAKEWHELRLDVGWNTGTSTNHLNSPRMPAQNDNIIDRIRSLIWVMVRILCIPVHILSWMIMNLFGTLFGFGYSSVRASLTILALLMFGWVGSEYAMTHGILRLDPQAVQSYPRDEEVAEAARVANRQATPAAARADPSGPANDPLKCSGFDAFIYTLDLMLPLIDLHVEEKCTVSLETPLWAMKVPDKINKILALARNPIVPVPQFDTRIVYQGPGFWALMRVLYAVIGWVVVSVAILTYSGLLRQKVHPD